ncbi:HNH endonuclease signature motif containing protein [Microbacterium sp. SLBN-146]|uniref:HNH endonuclease signature motif containing protein n=1 Tax=Microbacterium sp. SLBN-146 TaxID=2768457 RepID=UPI0011740D5F|nr:HNH endonuclease signature motif containing protein [Microbacterium sp. SLBN-146]TQJ31012.1 hypothetical protein FBY39_1471 [Microbacterium sp. SLBN-146]
MRSPRFSGISDGDAAVLAQIVADVEKSQSIIAAAQAEQTRALARAGELARTQTAGSRASVRDHDMALRSIAAELAGVFRVTDRSVQRQIGDASVLVADYSESMAAWESGRITRGHVRVIAEAGAVLPVEQRGEFECEALRRCERETPGRVRAELDLLAQHLHPRPLTERHAEAAKGRRVRVVTVGDGMSELCATMPSLLADAIYDRITQQARSVIDARKVTGTADDGDADAASRGAAISNDTRTTDQVRVDVFADMLLTAAPDADPTRTDDGPGVLGAIRAKVQVVVPALALLGVTKEPADLVGRSPIDADTARRLAGATRVPWERILTHPVTGAVLHVDAYHRTTAIDRHLRARDQHCRFPGCRMPAVRCEVDHTVDAARGGPTRVENLAHLCQRHHSMKQFTAWRVRQLPGGVLQWTSPLGRVYDDHPPTLGVHFRPSGSPDATPNWRAEPWTVDPRRTGSPPF